MRSSRFTTVGLTLVAALAAYELTLKRLHGDVLIVPLILAAIAVVAVVLRPRYAVLGILLLTYLSQRPLVFSFAGIRTDPGEVLAFALIGAWVVHLAINRTTPRTGYGRSVFVLLVAICVGAVVGASRGVDDQLLKGQTKAYLLYLLILPLGAFFATREDKRRLERWVISVATVGAVYVLVELARGHQVAPGGGFNTLGISASATRLKPAVLELMVVASMLVLARIVTQGATALRVAQLGLFVTLFALSFYRSTWVGLILGGLLLLAVAPGRDRARRAVRGGLVVGIVAPVLLTLASSGSLGQSAREVPRRLFSVLSPEIREDSSYTDRSSEASLALRAISRNPIVGVGIGGSYGATFVTYSDSSQMYAYVDRPFSHNSYLQLYLHMGLLGVAGMTGVALVVGGNIRRQLRSASTELGREDAIRAAAAAAALLAEAFKALFDTQLFERPAIVALVIVLTLAHRPSHDDERSPREDQPTGRVRKRAGAGCDDAPDPSAELCVGSGRRLGG